MRRAFGLLALTFATIAPVTPLSAIAVTPDHAVFRYEQGFAATGSFGGACELVGIRFPSGQGVLDMAFDGGVLRISETRHNKTIALPEGPRTEPVYDRPVQTVTERQVEGGARIEWAQGDHVFLVRRLAGFHGSLAGSIEGRQWQALAPVSRLEVGSHRYYEPFGDSFEPFTPAITEPGRALRVPRGLLTVEGSGIVRMDGARVVAGALRVDLPPSERIEAETRNSAFVRQTLVETHADLVMHNLRFRLPSDLAETICQDLAWQGGGVVTFHASSGEVSRSNGRKAFDRQELTLNGVLAFQEGFLSWSQEANARTDVRTEGTFHQVRLNLEPVLVAPRIGAPMDAVGAAIGIAAVLGLVGTQFSKIVGFLYCRIGPEKALLDPTRAFIAAAARDSPGIILRDLVGSSQRPYGVIRHHARILAYLGLIKTLRRGKSLHVYPANASLSQARRELLLSLDSAARFVVERVVSPTPLQVLVREVQDRFGYSKMGA